MTRKRIQFVLSLLVTVVCLWWAFRGVELRKLWEDLRQINYWWLIPFCAVTFLSMYFRAMRWKYLLEPIVDIPSHKVFPPLIICFALNGMLPGRAGEFARAYLVSRDYRARFSSALATVVVERIADGVGLLAMLVVIFAVVPLNDQLSVQFKNITIDAATLRTLVNRLLVVCVVLLAGTILMLWGPFRRLVQTIIVRLPLLPHKIKERIAHFIETFVHGFHSLRSPRIIFWVVFHTLTVWLTVGWSLSLMSRGFSDLHISFSQGMATAIIICIAIMIPAAPGYWGLYEVGCILSLKMLGVVPLDDAGHALALSYSLIVHTFQLVCTIGPGLFFLWRRHVGLSELTHAEPPENSPPNS